MKTKKIKKWMKVCPNCGHIGRATVKGSLIMEIILWLCFLLPGFIYTMWRTTQSRTTCPKCKESGMVSVKSPRGQKLVKEFTDVGETA